MWNKVVLQVLGRAEKQNFHIPFAVSLLDSQGRLLELQLDGDNVPAENSKVLTVSEQQQEFVFTGVTEQTCALHY